MSLLLSFQLVTCLSAFVRLAAGVCQSSGTDFVDGGGPYCINTTSLDYFSFGTLFTGCATSDAQDGEVTPILIDPNTDEFFCSGIPIQPNEVAELSTCNVAGNVVQKSQMVSGTWTVIIEGLTFAYMRTFDIIAGPPAVVTTTPTASFTSTLTPTVTVTATSIHTLTSTLPPVTTVVPSSTKTFTVTSTPKAVTTTVTSLATLTLFNAKFTTTVTTKTKTLPCVVATVFDRKATITPTKTPAAAATKAAKRGNGREAIREAVVEAQIRARELHDLIPRTPDLCTTTVVATTNLPSTTFTVTAPTSSFSVTTDVTTTSTVTPPPVTSYSGVISTTITVTKPTQTITKTSRGITTTVSTITIVATIPATTTVRAPGC